jgi:aspartate/methionine/tyrosine aminotransferase
VLSAGLDGVVAVHSLSKRSNLAGARVGFYAGDPDLVGFLLEVRKHAGLMVPGPVQAGGAVAYADDEHVVEQRLRYHERLTFLAGTLAAVGVPTSLPAGGFYLWTPVPEEYGTGAGDGADGSAAWALTEALAVDGGLLVSPGDLYGVDGAGHVRVAVVQTMERLERVADRLSRVGSLTPR